MSAATAAEPPRARRQLTIAGWFTLTRGLLLLVAVIGGGAGLVSLSVLADARTKLLDEVAPVNTASQALQLSLVNQETGVRGFLLARDPSYLAPYREGQAAQRGAAAQLRAGAPKLGLQRQVATVVEAADAWQADYAEPVVQRAREGGRRISAAEERTGKARFDAFRAANADLRVRVDRLRASGRADLTNTATTVRWIFIAFIVLILLSVLGTAIILRREVIGPMSALAGRVRRVAGGDHESAVTASGARDVQLLADDVEDMRVRILEEVTALETAQEDLKRSNAELEQFAYVASHDLQEPLRKVASFCQMLQRRYGGQLDERGEQYIEFAVDGAKRMQDLINDLLAFSRVGRVQEPEAVVDCNAVMQRVQQSLEGVIEAKGASVEVEGELPQVRGEPSLLALVFQNLVANGLKFQAEGVAPHVRLSVRRRDDDLWEFTVSDNGIGIGEEYAERIFVIFQRLHPRSAYEGTGIGLAMCRKVIEHHGGTIWLDTAVTEGATFHFTLPVLHEEPSPA